MNLELGKFDMRSISFRPDENKGPVIVLIGRRDTGKSFLVKDLMYYHQDIPIGTVISGTEAGNGFFGEHVPKLFIHDAYNTAIIENILKRQKAVLKQVKKEIESFEPKFICHHCNEKFTFELSLMFHLEKKHNIKIENYESISNK